MYEDGRGGDNFVHRERQTETDNNKQPRHRFVKNPHPGCKAAILVTRNSRVWTESQCRYKKKKPTLPTIVKTNNLVPASLWTRPRSPLNHPKLSRTILFTSSSGTTPVAHFPRNQKQDLICLVKAQCGMCVNVSIRIRNHEDTQNNK